MSDYDSIVQDMGSAAQGLATTSIDKNPDEGAEALRLSRQTGVSPYVIHQDVDGFKNEYRAKLASNLIQDNGHLDAYIRGNPMADVVSNDDYGNLSNFSEKAGFLSEAHKFLNNVVPYQSVYEGLKGAAEGGWEGFVSGVESAKVPEKLDTPDWGGATIRSAALYGAPLLGVLGAIPGAIFGGAKGFAEAEGRRIYGDTEYGKSQAALLAKDAQGVIEELMGRGPGAFLPSAAARGRMGKVVAERMAESNETAAARLQTVTKVNEVLDAAKPWIDAGLEPPRGVHPEIDRVKTDMNSVFVKQLQEVLSESEKSTTKERDPELFSNFVKQHFEDSTIGISGDRIAELYKDKVPSPDDGLLGWVPDIEKKLEVARATGEDVHVSVADWLAKVDPALARDLGDDIRAWPGGITKTEAMEKLEQKPVVDSPMAKVRANGLEPMFAIGDRKLTLEPSLKETDAVGLERHEYKFLDQDGNDVGFLELYPDAAKKQLYIGMIGGKAGLYSNSFGPSLIRDLKRQLKELYPEYETITGHRVTGARYADKWFNENLDQRNPTDHPVVKLSLDAPEDAHLGQLLDGLYTQQFSQGISAHMIPKRMWLENEHLINNAVQDVIRRMTGGSAEAIATHGIEHESIPGDFRGVYLGGEKTLPKILFDLMDPEAVGIARHEAIHHLYHSGLFTDAEWSALLKASEENKWRERYGIDKRYSEMGLDDLSMHEEAIAEAYREWAATKDKVSHPDSLVGMAFQKIHDLLEAIKERVKEILPWGGDVHELFEKVDTGEIGKRAGVEAEGAGPKFSLSPEDYQVKLDNLRAEAAGLDLKSWKKMQKLIQDRFAEDLNAAQARAEKMQKKEQTKEWKENAKDIRKGVEENIQQRPDVMADLFVGQGQINGNQLEKRRYPLRAEDLSDEQKAGLPRHYYSKEGLPVDAVANLLGFHSGDEFVRTLSEYNAAKEGRTPLEQLKKVTEDEVQRQMEAQYGKLDENIMLEARDQALSETNLNILAEEWQGAAMQAGIEVVDKDFAKATAKQMFSQMKIGEVDRGRLMTSMLKLGRDAERALIAGKPADAVRAMERKYLNGLMAAEAMKLEKEQKSFDRTAKQFSKREVASVPSEYTNFVHDILMRVGKPVRRSVQDLAKEIQASGYKDLESFVADKTADLKELAVWDGLYEDGWRKNLNDLSVEEFRAVKGSVDSLVHNGRMERKIIRQGELFDLDEIKGQLVQAVVENVGKEIAYGTRGERVSGAFRGELGKYPLSFLAAHLQLENIFNRWDGFSSKGVWNQFVMRDLVDGANQVDAWRKEFGERWNKLNKEIDLKSIERTIENPLFRDPGSERLFNFTRKNLIAVMLNTGTPSNLVKLAKGYKLEPDEVMAWVNQHATKEEWKYVRGIWDMFRDIKDRSDTMYRSLSGVPAEDVPTHKVYTPHGEIDGGYYPVIYHPEFVQDSAKLSGKASIERGLEQENYVRATTPNGYTKQRTGYVGPMWLDLDLTPGRIAQMLHDIGLRPAVVNASKIFYDKGIQQAIKTHAGSEIAALLDPYLRGVANSSDYMSRNQSLMNKASEFLRQNLISTLIGLNPGTVMKHGPSAAILSMREVGPMEFLKATRSLFSINEATGESNWRFAIENSLELQRRDRNWETSMFGATGALTPGDKYGPLRQKIMEWSSKPVAMSDMLSAVPTWLAKYEMELRDGASHGDAVYEADRAVRRAHGSTAITNRTQIMREASPWFTSVYNFFSDIMNRQMETVWKAGEAADLAKSGDKSAAMKMVPPLIASAFAYVLWPAIVENAVSPEGHDEHESWGMKAGKAITFTLGSSWVGVRDLAHFVVSGRDPQAGLLGTAGSELTNVVRDLMKDKPGSREHRGKLIQDMTGFAGLLFGLTPLALGKAVRFTHDVNAGIEHPKGPWAWATGLRYGTTNKHSTTFENYMKGRSR